MKKYKTLLIVVASLLIVSVGVLWYIGFLTTVSVTEREIGPYTFVCHEHFGDYSNSPKIIDSLKLALSKDGFETSKAFGIYYDKPGDKPVDSLHSIIGCILNDKDTSRLYELERKGYMLRVMGKTPSMVVDFPARTSLSALAGIGKAYPALNEYATDKGFKSIPDGKVGALEVYEPGSIIYAIEIRK